MANFFSKVSRRFSDGQKGSVNLTFNAFLHRKFSSMYIMVPGGSKMVVPICVLVGGGRGSDARELTGSRGSSY